MRKGDAGSGCVLLKRKKQKARPKGVNLKVRWRAKVAMRYCSEESAAEVPLPFFLSLLLCGKLVSIPSLTSESCRRGREAKAGPLQEGRQTPPQRAPCPSKATLNEHGRHRATRKRLCFHSQPHRVCASVRPCAALETCQRLPPCPHCCSVERAAASQPN